MLLIESNFLAVNGAWSAWSETTSCTVTCGGGTQDWSRTCTNPEPAHGGEDCNGELTQQTTCKELACPGIILWTRLKPSFAARGLY